MKSMITKPFAGMDSYSLAGWVVVVSTQHGSGLSAVITGMLKVGGGIVPTKPDTHRPGLMEPESATRRGIQF